MKFLHEVEIAAIEKEILELFPKCMITMHISKDQFEFYLHKSDKPHTSDEAFACFVSTQFHDHLKAWEYFHLMIKRYPEMTWKCK